MPSTPSESRSRHAILRYLKQNGPQDAQCLADQLAVSAMAVRQHLYRLESEKLVTHQTQPRPIGRPAKLWQLTAAADAFFPDGHADLTVDLIEGLAKAFGAEGLEKLLAVRAKQQIQAYQAAMPKRASLRRRLEKLAEVRTREGYMAEVLAQEDKKSFLLVENHCPICAAAAACTGLCGAELAVFQAMLGRDVEVTRTEHIVAGARRCAYRVERRK